MTPLSVSAVPLFVTLNTPVPPVAMVKGFVLDAVEPVYCSVPVVPLAPNVTAVTLLPNTPLALALLIVAMLKVPL